MSGPGAVPVALQTGSPTALQVLRRELHRVPETGLHLPATQAVILRELQGLGLDDIVTGKGLSSVTAVLHGAGPGPTVLLRADMDALPIDESSGVDYAADSGAMHACGHDLHMAGMVGAVHRLVARRHEFAGSIVFAFQPGEEGFGGGRLMVEEGVLDISGDRAAASYAIHVWPQTDRGTFLTRPGAIMAGLNELRVSVRGVGGHASSPHLLRDTVPVLSEIVMALQSFVSRRIDVRDPVVLSVTHMNAESAAINVIPERSTLAASVRTLSPESVALLAEELPRLVTGIARAHGCEAEVSFQEVYPVTVNSAAETRRAMELIGGVFGQERVEELEHSLMASEDFAFFLREAPGAFLLLGARPDEIDAGSAYSAHSPHVQFDDGVLDTYARALEALALGTLPAA